jgi:transketolase
MAPQITANPVDAHLASRRLEEAAASIKRRFLEMYFRANAGHVGSSLSCAEMLAFVRLGWMAPSDDLVLSKGHAAAALYATLAEAGDLSADQIATFYQDGTLLSAHPPPNKLPRIPFATGSLGHGVSLAAGLAFAAKLRGEANRRVFCVASDGELDEGTCWEAALFAAQNRLHNLVWLVDRNRIQGFGRTEDVMSLEPLDAKLRAFNWDVYEANGHSMPNLLEARDAILAARSERPSVIICQTVKGNGMGVLSDTVDCHYKPMTREGYDSLVTTLERGASPGLAETPGTE